MFRYVHLLALCRLKSSRSPAGIILSMQDLYTAPPTDTIEIVFSSLTLRCVNVL